ncbi:penicillin-binding protein [Candidatus Dojkabacteria bacterium]|uniref:Penicillin-binding protein n=1 Tax=Candidatus Dojkabacteria bacterium TaxID=2099670 RepID=A0A5C7J7M9_9BACT|nr:MAG: penicillin-binding protein [Candidatus Dojkabacteria bacterium]
MLYWSPKQAFSSRFRRSPRRDLVLTGGPKRSWKEWPWKKLFRWAAYLALAGVLFVGGVFAYFAKDLPNPGNFRERVVAESTKIYDRSGTHLLYEVHGEEKRTVIPFADMPDVVKYATISLEDQEFYHHFGVNPAAILRAVLKDIITLEKAQGGSTITQQLVKNTLLTNEKSITRKVKEVILSLELEAKYSKDEILEMYLNEIPYGSNAYGIEAAAQTFFGKPARELTLDEAALLAALPQATTYYSPYGSHTDALSGRQSYVLKQMADLGYITPEQRDEAIGIDTIGKVKPQKDIIAAPHFVMYIKDQLQEKFGDRAIEEGGYKVITTLDWDKQTFAEQAVREGAEKNKKWQASNAALVAIDPKNGQILSMVGSKDYFDESIDGQVNVSIRDRQPGSSFKPYVYLTAFTKGYLPETIMYDVETEFETNEGKSYKPNNYDGKFHGPLPMMKALGGSLNIPAVKTLYLVGVQDAIALAKSLGIAGLNDPDRVGLSLVLGGGEVKLLDHVHAYATLATGGIKHPLASILKIEDSKGTVLESFNSTPGERVIEEKYVAMLDSVLSNNDNRAWVFGESSPLRFDNRQVAAKTGTTNEFRDGWTIGYTPSIAVGVWAGNNDNAAMVSGADGVNVAAPIWRSFLDHALINQSSEEFPKYNPDDEIGEGEGKTDKPLLSGKLEKEDNIKVCEIPGEDNKYCLANKYCPESEVDKKDFVSTHDILHYVDRGDPRGPKPKDPENDSQYKNWEKAVKEWYKKEKTKGIIAQEVPEKECDEDDFKKYKPSISLSIPSSTNSNSITLEASVSAPYGVKKVTFSVDGNTIDERSDKPYRTTYTIPDSKNNQTLSVSVTLEDNNGNKTDASGQVSVSF